MSFIAGLVGFSAKTAVAVGVSVGLVAAAGAGVTPAGADAAPPGGPQGNSGANFSKPAGTFDLAGLFGSPGV